MDNKNLTNEQMEQLYKVADFIQEKDLYSELRHTPHGPFLIFGSVDECKMIEEFVNNELGLAELPCQMGYADEHMVCDCCGKVFCTTPDSAFWKKNWLIASDSEVYCDDCVTVEMMIEEFNHKYDKVDSVLTEKHYIDAGYTDYCKEKYGVEYVVETKKDYESIMEEVSNYENAIFLMVHATPFEADVKLFVK